MDRAYSWRPYRSIVGAAFDGLMAFCGFILVLTLLATFVVSCLFVVFDAPTCRGRGEKMNLDVSWEFWTGCMVRVQDQWLPWGEVVPIERTGKIVFAPKQQR